MDDTLLDLPSGSIVMCFVVVFIRLEPASPAGSSRIYTQLALTDRTQESFYLREQDMAKPHDPSFTIDEYTSSTEGTIFITNSDSRLRALALAEDPRPFDYHRYAQEIHPAVPLPQIDTSVLADEYPRCLDMPIRLAGDAHYSVPSEWTGLVPLIHQIVELEQSNNPNWRDYHTYMTVDCKHVEPEEQQRHGGLHVDGFQGERHPVKHKVTRNYVVTTNGGTRFYPQHFIVADPAKFNVFQGFDLQAEDYFIATENVVHFMNAYSVHESGIASRSGLRTFLRVTFDLKEFDRLGNTKNSMLDYDWEMVARKVHDEVATPHLSDIEESPFM